jgi:hypothetical protein
MNMTPPRYEYRAWAEDLSFVADRIQNLSKGEPIRTSEEMYLVLPAAGINPKIRDVQLDIKVLVDVQQGFEQWEPRLKAEFPLPIGSLREEALELLNVANPPDIELTLDRFLALIEDVDTVRAVSVVKERRGFTVAGCITEVASVAIGGIRLETAAVESADLDAAVEARRLTGLADFENVNYPTIIKRTVG